MKISRIDIIATNGNDGLHYKEKRMRTPYKYTDDELKLMAQSFNDVLSTLDEITEEKRREKCIRAVAAMLSDSVRKVRLPKADPNQLSFEDKLVMEETLRGPDYPDEDNSH